MTNFETVESMGKRLIVYWMVLLLTNPLVIAQCVPVASYPFNGNANDVSGNMNHGILGGESNNPVLTTDRFGVPNSAYEFGGYYNKNWIQVPNSPSLQFGNTMSFSLWFQQCSFAGMDGWGSYSTNGTFILVSKAGDGIAANPGFWCNTYVDASNLLYVSFCNTNGNPGSSLNFAEDTTYACFDPCQWLFVTVVVQDTTWRMYFNAQLWLEKKIAPVDFSVANGQDMFFGRMNCPSTIWYPFDGKIDDINIYNCALSQAQISALYGAYVDSLAANNTIVIDSLVAHLPCSASSGTITVYADTINGPYQYSLDGINFQGSNTFSNVLPGTYTIRIRSDCTFKDTTLTLANDPVNVTAVAGMTSLCAGESTTLTASGAASYIWSDGLGSNAVQTVSPATTTTYWVTGTDDNGCSASASVSVTVTSGLTVGITASATEICPGQTVTLTASGGATYSWSDGLGTDAMLTLAPAVTTTYTVLASSTNGCTGSSQVVVNVHAAPVADFYATPPEGSMDDPVITFNSGTFAASWLWTFGDGAQSTQAPPVQHAYPAEAAPYTVTLFVANDYGCIDSVSKMVTIRDVPLFFPNVITPNDDGLNDFFVISNAEYYTNTQLTVYNRWGGIVYSANNYRNDWDGGKCPDGTYFYIFSYLDKTYQSTLTILH